MQSDLPVLLLADPGELWTKTNNYLNVLLMKTQFQFLLFSVLASIQLSAQVTDESYLSPPAAVHSVYPAASDQVRQICGSGSVDHMRAKPPLPTDPVNPRGVNALPVNPYIVVQGIHNVVAKWYGGSVYRYDIGTGTSGLLCSNINSGSLLNNYQTNTGGHSYPELQASALAKGTQFSIGQLFYLNLYYTPASSSSGKPDLSLPATFNWTPLGDPSYNVTITVATTYAVGSTAAVPFTAAQAAKLQTFYDLVNPIVKEVYGPPSINHTVTVVNDAFAIGKNVFYNGPDEISSNNVNMINSYGDLDQPRLLVHELIHAYRDNVCLSTNSMWHYDPALSGFEEGCAEGVALIVMDIFNERYPAFFSTPDYHRHWNEEGGMPFEWNYDFNNHHQITTEDFWSSDIATGSGTLRYGLGAAAIRKMYIEDPNVFKNFNAEYYKRLNANHTLIPDRPLVVDIFQSVKPFMERTSIAKWIDQQYIFDCKIDQRKKIFMLSYTSSWWGGFEHDNRIFFVETHKYGSEWYWQSSDQAGTNEIPLSAATNSSWSWTHQLNNIDGDLKFVRDWNNTVLNTRTIKTSSHWITENPNDPTKFNKPLLGPYQGANPWYIGTVFTRDHEQDNCTVVPGCGKRAWAFGNQPMYTTTASAKPGILPSRVELNMHESGLFRFEISFNDPKGPVNKDMHFRLLGDDFADMKGLCGGIYSPAIDQVDGKLFIEHEKYPNAEAAITIKNNSFKTTRTWTAIPAVKAEFQMGRNDVAYTTPGKVHAIYVSQDCSKMKMDFRTVGYGCLINGSEMLLFNVDEMEDILFTASSDTTLCKGESFTLKVTNNFTDILNREKGARIKYTWRDPNNAIVSTDTVFTKNNAAFSDAGKYTLSIEFFGCPAAFTKTINITIDTATAITLAHPADITVCAGESIQLSSTVISGKITSFDWTGPNGYTQTNVQNPVITNALITQGGQYIVTVKGIGCGGTSVTAKDTINVTVNNSIPLQLAAVPDTSVCVGGTIYLKTKVVSGTAISFDWTGPNGYTQTNVQNPVISNAQLAYSGQYIVTVTGKGCGSNAITANDTIFVTVNNSGNIQLFNMPDTTLCIGGTIQLKAKLSSGTAISYDWIGPNGYSQTNVQNPVITAAQLAHSGQYIVTAKGVGCGGVILIAKDTILVTINDNVPIQLQPAPDIIICEGQSIQLNTTVISGTVLSFDWTGPNNYTQINVQNPVIPNANSLHAGLYTVKVTGTGCGGAAVYAIDSIVVTVNSNPTVNPVISPVLPACPGNNVMLSVNTVPAATYVWTGPGGFSDTLRNSVISAISNTNQGIYTVRVTVPGCLPGTFVTGTANVNVIVKDGKLSPIADQKICEGEVIQLSATVSATANMFEWTAPNGTVVSTASVLSISSFSASDTGTYRIHVDFGCSALDTFQNFNLALRDKNSCHPSPSYFMPTAFSPNGDGQNDILYLYGNAISKMSLSIYDRWGALVFSTTSQSIGWDGTYKGELLNTSVFAYKLFIQFNDGSESVKLSGNVTLVR